MIKGGASNCTEKGCMGKPKKTNSLTLEGYVGTKCAICFRVVEYEKTETMNDKTLVIDEAELKKLEGAANDKKPNTKKSNKKNENKQGTLNL